MKPFKCYSPDQASENEAELVEALDAERAAENFACDNDIQSGEGWSKSQVVMVHDGRRWIKFTVSAWTEVHYQAEEE